MAHKKGPHYQTEMPHDQPKEAVKIEPAVKFVVDSWDQWNSHWSSKMTEFDSYYDRWIGKPPQRDEDWQSQFHKKLTWQAVATLVARFFAALWPISAPIDCEAPENKNTGLTIIAKSLAVHWFKIGKFSKEFLSGMRAAGIYGTGLFEDDWYVRTEEVFEKVDEQIPDFRQVVNQQTGEFMLDEEGNVQVQQIGERTIKRDKGRFKVVEDRYRVRKTNIFAWRIHPDKLSDEDDLPVIKQEFVTFNDLKKMERNLNKYGIEAFENMEKIEKDVFKISEEDIKRMQKDGQFIDRKNPRLQLLYYWGEYALKEGDEGFTKDADEKPSLIMIINRKYRLKLIDNPRWDKKSPLFHIVWTEDERPSYYGIGLAQIGKEAEDRANNNVNIRTDVKKKNIRGTGYYNASDKKLKKKLVMKNTPGLMRPATDPSRAVWYDTPPSLLPEDYKEEEVAVNDHREITGSVASLQPAADISQQHKTLGGLELLSSQATQRLKPDLTMMEIMGIRQMANRGMLLTRQFYTEPEAVELIASDDELRQAGLSKIYKIPPEKIMEKVEFFCTGLSETFDKLQNIDKLLKYIEVTSKIPIMQQLPQYAGFVFNIMKRIGLWLGIEDAETLVPDVPGLAPEQPLGQPQLPPGGQPGPVQGGSLSDVALAQIAQSMLRGQGGPPQ